MSASQRGLSLIEIGIVLALITVLMLVSLPMLTQANAEARSVVCRENLSQIGDALSGYTRDNHCLPIISDQPPQGPGLSLPEFAEPRLTTPNALFCPSDETQASKQLGTSYRWATAFNGLAVDDFDRALDQPLLTDRKAFHDHAEASVNALVIRRSASQYQFVVTGSDSVDVFASQPDPTTTQHTDEDAKASNTSPSSNTAPPGHDLRRHPF